MAVALAGATQSAGVAERVDRAADIARHDGHAVDVDGDERTKVDPGRGESLSSPLLLMMLPRMGHFSRGPSGGNGRQPLPCCLPVREPEKPCRLAGRASALSEIDLRAAPVPTQLEMRRRTCGPGQVEAPWYVLTDQRPAVYRSVAAALKGLRNEANAHARNRSKLQALR